MAAHTLGTRAEWLSAYARGLDGLWTMWQWLDRAPLGRNEGDLSWLHRHDEYPPAPGTAAPSPDERPVAPPSRRIDGLRPYWSRE
jgi:hypothetical protein